MKGRGRGCLLILPCGCKLLDGRPFERCDRHKDEGGTLMPSPEQDAWLKRQEERQ